MSEISKTKKSLPEYYAIICPSGYATNKGWKKYIAHLNKIAGTEYETWDGNDLNCLYGYDGGKSYYGTFCYSDLKPCLNPPVLLTLDEFMEMTEPQPEVDEPTSEPKDSFIPVTTKTVTITVEFDENGFCRARVDAPGVNCFEMAGIVYELYRQYFNS